MEYAGFWRRFVAYIIDNILISIVFGLIVVILAAIAGDGGAVVGYVLATIGIFVYFAYMESSERQATVGKIALGIQVTDMNGARVSFGKALGRNLGKVLSALIIYIGFIMAAFTEKKQALHDIMAGCLVVKKGSPTTSTASSETPM
jgi:uncharacterized RDD family membrane protein YckC